MPKYQKRSRILKAFTDAARVGSFGEAEARLDAVALNVVVDADEVKTPAGQAAVLTGVATARKCFGRVVLSLAEDAPLIVSLPIGATVMEAGRRLGANVIAAPDQDATHTIRIGKIARQQGWSLGCWWDRWLTGTRALDDEPPGDSELPLAGVFAAAIGVRQVFACVLAGRELPERDVSVSLWTPWEHVDPIARGPRRFDVPDKVWLVGLGHLGQAFVWNLCQLPSKATRRAVLQDDQSISEENEGTSLLVLPGGGEKGERKTRSSARWLESGGWVTEVIERRHYGDIAINEDDPPYLLCGLDRVEPRLVLARHGFPYMLDAGIGHGPGDFEGIQIRTIGKGQLLDGVWEKPESANDAHTKKLLESAAYQELEQHVGQCGKLEFAEASVAVPFVGAAAGALAVAQLIRLASLEASPLLLGMALGAPEMTMVGGFCAKPETNLGSFSIRLQHPTAEVRNS